MAKKALIHNGLVVQVEKNTFPVHPALVWVDCPDDVATGFTFDGEAFHEPVMPEPEEKPITEIDVLKAALKAKGVLNDVEIEAARTAEKAKVR